MTVKLKYGDNDRASDLAREGIYRINTGIRKDTFRKLFGDLPGRPKAGGIVDMNYVEEAYELAKEKFAKRCL